MSTSTQSAPDKKMTAMTLAVMNITAVVSLRFLPSEAEYGLSVIFYYLFAALVFLVPMVLIAAEMATTFPQKGGAFRWVSEAYGPRWGFLAMAMVWIEVIPYFPTVLTFGAVSVAFMDPNTPIAESIAANKYYITAFVLIVYWISVFIAFRGVGVFAQVSKWCGIVGTIIPAIVVTVLGFAYLFFSGQKPAIEMSWSAVIPDFSNFNNIVLAASIFLAYAGMEMNAVHVKDLDNPTKQYPVAIIISALGSVAIFVLSTLAISFVIPAKDISLTQSLLVTYTLLFHWAGVPWLSEVVAAMLAFGVLGGVVTWIAGPNAGVLAVAKAGFLPRWFQKTNKHGMGVNLMILQAIIVSILSLTFVVMPSVQAAFQILSALTVLLYLVMYMLMFTGALHLRIKRPELPRPYRVKGMAFWAILGFLGSLIAFILSFIPPGQIAVGSPTTYVIYLVVLVVIFVILPLVIYRLRKPEWRDPNSDFEPFTWEVAAQQKAQASAAAKTSTGTAASAPATGTTTATPTAEGTSSTPSSGDSAPSDNNTTRPSGPTDSSKK